MLNFTTARLTAILVVAQLVTLGFGLYAMASFTRQTITSDARTAAEVARDDFDGVLRQDGLATMVDAIRARIAAHEDRDFVVLLRAPDGRRVAGNLARWPRGLPTGERWRVYRLLRDGTTETELVGLVTTRLPNGYALLTGEILEAQAQLTRVSERAFVYALVMGIVLAAIVAAAVARTLERRIDAFSAPAAEFAAGKLEARVRLNRTGDAFDRLGTSINAMLDRIGELLSELRMVTDSMAHDLRSPVGRIKVALEQVLVHTGDPRAAEALGDAIDEVDGLNLLLDTALEISRAEAGIGRDRLARILLPELLGDLAEVYGPLAEEEGFRITVDVDQDLELVAHRELLFRAISNLIDNALKYAEGGSSIVLSARVEGDEVNIQVTDDGPGIAPDERAEALRRFGRLDRARTRAGAGLGLSLVETVAHLHGGSIAMEANSPRGLVVIIKLACDPPAPSPGTSGHAKQT